MVKQRSDKRSFDTLGIVQRIAVERGRSGCTLRRHGNMFELRITVLLSPTSSQRTTHVGNCLEMFQSIWFRGYWSRMHIATLHWEVSPSFPFGLLCAHRVQESSAFEPQRYKRFTNLQSTRAGGRKRRKCRKCVGEFINTILRSTIARKT